MAQTNRLISIATGLMQARCSVKVICIKPTENQRISKNNEYSGAYRNIEFVYSSGTPYRGKNPLRRTYLYFAGILMAGFMLIKDNKRDKIDVVFMGVTNLLNYVWFYLICKALRIKYIQERSEYPFIKDKWSYFDKYTLYLYLTFVCKFFDGFVVITHRLHEYFKPHLRNNCPVFLLPILVEPQRFSLETEVASEEYIAYCGSMQGDKDGIPILIDAFKIFNDDYPGIKLYLIGSTHFNGFPQLQEKINSLAIQNHIVFTGPVIRDDLPQILGKALMLVLARPDNKQSEAGFPTKLGEYLATGKPVVVTRVGEIPEYLEDHINAFIAPPGDSAQFAMKMKHVMLNYDEALKIGQAGRQLAQTTFNSTLQGNELAHWLKKLKNG